MPPACRSKYTRAPPRPSEQNESSLFDRLLELLVEFVDDEIHFIVVFEEEGGVKHPDLLRDLVDPTPVNPAALYWPLSDYVFSSPATPPA